MIPSDKDLWFLPLGGCGEIGMNLNLFGHNEQWLMVDCGVTFAKPGEGGQLPGHKVNGSYQVWDGPGHRETNCYYSLDGQRFAFQRMFMCRPNVINQLQAADDTVQLDLLADPDDPRDLFGMLQRARPDATA